MPPRGAFSAPQNLYETWAHKCVDWRGARHRLPLGSPGLVVRCDYWAENETMSVARGQYEPEVPIMFSI